MKKVTNHQRRDRVSILFLSFFVIITGEVFFANNSYSQEKILFSSNTLIECDFSVNTVERNSTEIISGTLQFYNGNLYLEVIEPIKQNIFITGPAMTMYYPESNQVIEFFGKTPFDLPIISSILPLFKTDYGLSDIGFIIDDFVSKNDTTVTTWIPKERNDQNSDSFFKLVYVSGVLHWVQHNSRKNSLDIVTHLSNYNELDEVQIPLLIKTTKKIMKKEVTESIELSNLKMQITETYELTLKIPNNAKREQYTF